MLFKKQIISNTIFLFIIVNKAEISETSLFSKVSDVLFCNKFFLEEDMSDSLIDLKQKVLWQPFVRKNLISILERHFGESRKKTKFGPKPMVLHFQGPVGVGKTFVADLLMKMKFFKNKYFFPALAKSEVNSPEKIESYKNNLKKDINNSIYSCQRSLFIFDDVNEIFENILYELPPFERINVPFHNYSESLFVYISQSDAEDIVSTTSDFVKKGISLFNIEVKDFMNQYPSKQGGILNTLWNSVSSIWNDESERDSKGVHEVYIPFLPLPVSAVRRCIQIEMDKLYRVPSKHFEEAVLESLGCYDSGDGFCPTGCKLVSSRLFVMLEKHDEL